MAKQETDFKPRAAISDEGAFFTRGKVSLMQEAAKFFTTEGLSIEILENNDQVETSRGGDMLKVRVNKGQNMRDLAPFWGKVEAIQLEQFFRAMGFKL